MKKNPPYQPSKEQSQKAEEPAAAYEKPVEPGAIYGSHRIVFSTLDTQADVQLKYAMSISPIERLELMRKLNDYAYKNFSQKNIPGAKKRLIFSRYEYIS